jgi:hypothetical protein
MAAVASMASVGETPSQPEALPLQGAAAGLGLSHQPAALFPSPYLAPWVSTGSTTDYHSDDNHPGETIEPTPSPVQAATVRAAAQGGSLSEAEVIAVLREAGAPEGWISPLLTIAFCESRWSPYAVGDGGNSLGMFQLWYGWARPMGYAPDDLYDPVKAARTALYVREVRGRFGGGGGWTCADLSGIY